MPVYWNMDYALIMKQKQVTHNLQCFPVGNTLWHLMRDQDQLVFWVINSETLRYAGSKDVTDWVQDEAEELFPLSLLSGFLLVSSVMLGKSDHLSEMQFSHL